MGIFLNGYVLKPARLATSNSKYTGEADSIVSREHITPTKMESQGYDIVPSVPVEPYADMYKASVLDAPEDSTQYMIFSANTSSFSVVEDFEYTENKPDKNIVNPLSGNIDIGTSQDGTIKFHIQDTLQRDILEILSLTFVRGDTSAIITEAPVSDFNSITGIAILNATTSTDLGGGFSYTRGDQVESITYKLSAPKYYWTRNDNRKTRFYWDAVKNRWSPIKGTASKSLGQILKDTEYKLYPPLSRFEIDQQLPNQDYALIRYGLYSDENSEILNCLVVSDSLVETGDWRSDLGWDVYDAVVGVSNGELLLKPDFIEDNLGIQLWYNPEDFDENNDGVLTETQNLDLNTNINHPVLSPVPEPGEYPFIRIGYRTYLTAKPVENDSALPDPLSIPKGEVYFSLTTGKTSFSKLDISKAKPGNVNYEKSFLLSKIYYDGVALCTQPMPIRKPVALLNIDGEPLKDGTTVQGYVNYLPLSVPLPPPGISGVMLWEDGSGDTPNLLEVPQTRPNSSGLRREISLGDAFFFNEAKKFSNTEVVEYDDDLTNLGFSIPANQVEVSKMVSLDQPSGYYNTSKVKVKKRNAKDKSLYFIQTGVTPSYYTDKAKIYSRLYEPYVFNGTEQFTFAINGSSYSLTLPEGTYSAEQVADLFNTALPQNTCGHFRGRFYISNSDPSTGSIEIGYNTDTWDLSGHAALGMLPTWRIEPQNENFRWLPDNGVFLGLYRDAENLNGLKGEPDTRAIFKMSDRVLENSIFSFPFQNVDNIPLEDIPGYDDGVHFKTSLGLFEIELPNYGFDGGVGIVYDFDESRLSWTQLGETPNTRQEEYAVDIVFDDDEILPETVSSDSMGDGFGLYYRDVGDSLNELIPGQDYLLLDAGASGTASFINVESKVESQGSGGQGFGNIFSNPKYSNSATQNLVLQQRLYDDIQVGFLLEVITGDSVGVYTVVNKSLISGIANFEVSPSFPVDFTGSLWNFYTAQEYTVLDHALVSDVKMFRTNHLPEEPFKIKALSKIGASGSSLNADVRDALFLERITLIRIGLEQGSQELPTYFLQEGTQLGVLQPSGLKVPDITDPHFTESTTSAYFQIRVGAEIFNTTLGNLTLDAGVSPNTIDVNTTTGEILVGESVFSEFASSLVYYDQLFRDPSNYTGLAEINPSTGEVKIPSSISSGSDIYFVEQMITESFQDVRMSVLNGGLLFNKPLKEGQIVEVEYILAQTNGEKKLDENGDPVKVIEFLPNMIKLEECTRIDEYTYKFNTVGKTTSDIIEPFVWVGSELQNYAGNITANINLDSGEVTFVKPVSTDDKVQINYAVLESPSGNQALSISTPPAYRYPFFLEAGQSEFILETNRTQDFSSGKLMSLGQSVMYITESSYNGSTDETTVQIFPPPSQEIGSRSPGADEILALSDIPVLVSKGGPTGLMLILDAQYQKLQLKSTEVIFVGDVTEYARAGHLLEIGSIPYMIADSAVSEDGYYTRVQINGNILNPDDNQLVRVSAREIIVQRSIFELPKTPVEGEPTEVFIVKPDKPGTKLIEGLDYTLTGVSLSLLREPLEENERLYLAYTSEVQKGPVVQNNAVLYPTYKAKYLSFIEPTKENRLEGSKLRGQYTYSNPDCFFFEVLPLREYLSEVSDELLTANIPNTTEGMFVANNTLNPADQGEAAKFAEVREYENKDRAARAYIELYNGIITGFEQVLETMDGRIIGDQDGKFRFFVGHDKKYAPPGWEDQFTGTINPRLIWREVVETWADPDLLLNGFLQEDSPLVNPVTAFEKDPVNNPGYLDGKTPDPDTLKFYRDLQRGRIKNDMDDRVLIGFSKPRFLSGLFPNIDVQGKFLAMWENHVMSRLFPEKTKHFSRLFPGIGALVSNNGYETPGYYTPGRTITKTGPNPGEEQESKVSTSGAVIGTVTNPAIGQIPSIVDISINERLCRARVWAYYPEGSQDLDDVLGSVTVGKATMVLSAVPLAQFPTLSGFPDPTKLISEGGQTLDLLSGNNLLSAPPFEVGQRLNYGKPDQTIYAIKANDTGVYVESIQLGCIITLMDGEDLSLTGLDIFGDSENTLTDLISSDNGYGDTVFGVPPNSFENVPADDESATVEQLADIGQGIPDMRIQFDIKVDKRNGELIDVGLPTKSDDFPINMQSLFGQRPPRPLTPIEGVVSFVNASTEPYKLPCLLGEAKDDTGDEQLPYIKSVGSEIEILSKLSDSIQILFQDMAYTPLPSVAEYNAPYTEVLDYQYWDTPEPDEILIDDGLVLDANDGSQDPAILYTGFNLRPLTTTGVYIKDSGIGSLRRGDLLFVEVNQSLSAPLYEGIHTVGDVTENTLELARFISPTTKGNIHKYTLRNYAAHKGGGTSGVVITESVAGSVRTIDFSFTSVLNFGFSAESTLLSSGQNLWAINIFDPAGGFIGTITIHDPNSGSGFWTYDSSTVVGAPLVGGGFTFISNKQCTLEMNSSAASPLLLLGLISGETYDFTLDMDTYIDGLSSARTGFSVSSGTGIGSDRCQILENKLTFTEQLDFRSAFPRDTKPFDGSNYEMGLQFGIRSFEDSSGNECSVNSYVETNNNTYFTFLERIGPDPLNRIPNGTPYVGVFDSTIQTGYLRMMSWERGGNIPFSGTDIRISAAPSSDIGRLDTTPISVGVGQCVDTGRYTLTTDMETTGPTTWIQNVGLTSGSLQNIQKGDMLQIRTGKSKDGTYLIRHLVRFWNSYDEDGNRVWGTKGYVNAGTKNAFDLRFPKIKSFISNTEIILKDVRQVPGSPSGHGFPSSNFYLYVIRDSSYAEYSGSYTVNADSVWRILVSNTSYDSETEELTCTGFSTPLKADGSSLSLSDFFEGLTENLKVTGMQYIKLNKVNDRLPDNNCVGSATYSTEALQAGFRYLTLGNLSGIHPTTPTNTWYSGSGQIRNKITGTQPSGTIAVDVPEPVPSNEFAASSSDVVYGRTEEWPKSTGGKLRGVVQHIDLTEITDAQWDLIHFDGTPPTNNIRCILPNDRITLGSNINPASGDYGYVAVQGIFLEPSFAKPVTTGYSSTFINNPRVVFQNNPYGVTPDYLIGMRQVQDFSNPVEYTEDVDFIVRRIRRFHDTQNQFSTVGEPLKYIYETRKGEIFSGSGKQFQATLLDNDYYTNVGNFRDKDINIKAGDLLRLYTLSGELVAESEIKRVVSDSELQLRTEIPNITSGTFEIYLANPIIPLEQSMSQILDAITDQVVFERKLERIDPNEDGGRVPQFNTLKDTAITNWQSTGVQEGDYIIIDPQGSLYLPNETGSRPQGDLSLSENGQNRVAYNSETGLIEDVYTSGRPSVLDDNRGFYRVLEQDPTMPDTLPVEGTNRFAGGLEDGTDNVVFGELVNTGTGEDYRYVLLPTISDSLLPTGPTEGQQSLRPTLPPNANSYLGRAGTDKYYSIEPFAYKIIRPSDVVSQDAIELVLFMRERILSWIEETRRIYNGNATGDYYIFQRDDHILDVGSPLDPSSGSGIIHNGFAQSVQGMVNMAPFVNTSDCLSFLDRRVHILDYLLDGQQPDASPLSYTNLATGEGGQRPVYPDYIDEVLNLEDDLRGSRYTWINARVNLITGTATQLKAAKER